MKQKYLLLCLSVLLLFSGCKTKESISSETGESSLKSSTGDSSVFQSGSNFDEASVFSETNNSSDKVSSVVKSTSSSVDKNNLSKSGSSKSDNINNKHVIINEGNLLKMTYKINSGTTNKSISIDFKSNTIDEKISGSSEPPKKKRLSWKETNAFISFLKSKNITEWKEKYTGTTEGVVDFPSWKLSVSFSDKTSMNFSGVGVGSNSKPAELSEIIDKMNALLSE